MRCAAGLFLYAILCGCGVRETRSEDAGRQEKLLPFLQEGRTTQANVAAALGGPSGRFEGDRVWTYRMKEHAHEDRLVVDANDPTHHLVMAFDEALVLRRFNLVKVRQ